MDFLKEYLNTFTTDENFHLILIYLYSIESFLPKSMNYHLASKDLTNF